MPTTKTAPAVALTTAGAYARTAEAARHAQGHSSALRLAGSGVRHGVREVRGNGDPVGQGPAGESALEVQGLRRPGMGCLLVRAQAPAGVQPPVGAASRVCRDVRRPASMRRT
jgi:hypothetical protein